ncbi:MAG: GntR family transcriptional regulator [Defluviicoccus sp.]|nr:GntR family transcriptional regulator [Defluviicoccus sp.]
MTRWGAPARRIVDTLRAEIVPGALAPDAPLGQERLALRFGVSRMPVREALGLVTVEANPRARVAPARGAGVVEKPSTSFRPERSGVACPELVEGEKPPCPPAPTRHFDRSAEGAQWRNLPANGDEVSPLRRADARLRSK